MQDSTTKLTKLLHELWTETTDKDHNLLEHRIFKDSSWTKNGYGDGNDLNPEYPDEPNTTGRQQTDLSCWLPRLTRRSSCEVRGASADEQETWQAAEKHTPRRWRGVRLLPRIRDGKKNTFRDQPHKLTKRTRLKETHEKWKDVGVGRNHDQKMILPFLNSAASRDLFHDHKMTHCFASRHPTVCVTRGWAGGENATLLEPT